MEKASEIVEIKQEAKEAAVEVPAPTPESDGFQSLDPRFIPYSRLVWFIFGAIVAGVDTIASTITFAAADDARWVAFIVAGVGLAVVTPIVVCAFKWPRLEYDRAQWRLDEVGFQIRRGVIWRRHVSIPIARVQHADVFQGPLHRKFGLGKLTLHTAGTQNASVAVEGLSYETALDLRDKLVAQRKTGHVV